MVGSGKIIWIRIRNTDISDRLKRWEFKGDGGGRGRGRGCISLFRTAGPFHVSYSAQKRRAKRMAKFQFGRIYDFNFAPLFMPV